MRFLRIALFASLAACSTSAVWAQYGLYGSPDVLRVPQTGDQTSAGAAYPNTAAPMAQPPASAYYPPQPQYGYPAVQPSPTGTYQPYQPGAQYRYPDPTTRTAAVDPAIQPIPAPAGMMARGPASLDASQSGPVDPMLADDGGCGSGSGGLYRGPLNRFEQQAGCGSPSNGSGFDSGIGESCCRSPWYASVSALALTRSDGRRLWTSYDASNEANQLTNTQDIPLPWQWGGEVSVGRRFCWCDSTWAVEATYWSTAPLTGSITTTSPNPPYLVSTPLRVFEVQFNGYPGTDWFDDAKEQTLSRRDEIQNFELNLIRQQVNCCCDSPWNIGWSLGFRYFRFEENLTYGSLQAGCNWGQQGGICEAYLNDTVTNDMFGFQIGFDAGYRLCSGLRLFVSPKVGIYDDHMNQDFRAYLGNGVEATTSAGVIGTYPVLSCRDQISFLTQIDLGAEWQLSRCWSARVGYRVVAITDIALADDQFPQYIVDVPEIAHIDGHGSLILHGAFAGLTYNF